MKFKKIIYRVSNVMLIVLMLITLMNTSYASDSILENVALGKTVTTSSNHSAYKNYGWYAPGMAVDGSWGMADGDRWLSGEGNNGGSSGSWIKVDLGGNYDLSRLEFQVRSNTGGSANPNTNYQAILICEDRTEEIVYTQGAESNTDKITLNFSPEKTCRYVMLRSNVSLANNYPASFGVVEIAAYGTPGEAPTVDIAKNKPTTVLYPYSSNYDGSEAVDDDDSNHYESGSHNGYESWTVDLGEDYYKYNFKKLIYIPYSPSDSGKCYSAGGFKIMVADKSDFSDAVEIYRNTDGVDARILTSLVLELEDTPYRYLRVEQLISGMRMKLESVSLMAESLAEDGINIAKGKYASASSQANGSEAKNILDGNFSFQNNVVKSWKTNESDTGKKPYVEIDLGFEYSINSIIIEMGKNDFSKKNFTVALLNEGKSSKYTVFEQKDTLLEAKRTGVKYLDDFKCRYILIESTVVLSDGEIFEIEEVMAFSRDTHSQIPNKITFVKSGKNLYEINVIPKSQEFAVLFNGISENGEKEVNLIQAGYDNGVLSSAYMYPITIPAGVSEYPIIQNVSVDGHDGTEFSFFIWDEYLQPLFAKNSIEKMPNLYESQIDGVDFVVNVENGRQPRVLQLTDTQIVESEDQRYDDRLGVGSTLYNLWLSSRKEENYKKICREVIQSYNPDLILVTGDLVYGEFDDDGTALLDFIAFMDSFKIPWAPVFGNHDNESALGADWQCDELENSLYGLFIQRTLTGNGNYTVGISQNDTLKRVFFMMDSNGCAGMSDETFANGHSTTSVGFADDQIEWYEGTATGIKTTNPNVKLSLACHIQPLAFADAYEKYGFTNSGTQSNPINIDTHPDKAEGDFGYLGRDLKYAWDSDYHVWNSLKTLGFDSIFVGHEHCNSASVVYDGIRCQYGQKSSLYDRANYNVDGTIQGLYNSSGTPIVGGTAMDLSETDGSIADAYIILNGKGETPPPLGEVLSETLDANGVDFDTSVNTSGLTSYAMSLLTDTTSVPAGYTDSVYGGMDTYINDIGIKLDSEILANNVTAVKVRFYVSDYTASKTPLLRIYDDTNNSILAEKMIDEVGLIPGQWCEIDILPMLKSAGRISGGHFLDSVLVYRVYHSAGEVFCYCDDITIEYVDKLK